MTPQEIKQKLRAARVTQAALAERWGKSTSAVCLVINRQIKSAAIEKKLARFLGVSLEKLREEPTAAETVVDLEEQLAEAKRIVAGIKTALNNGGKQDGK